MHGWQCMGVPHCVKKPPHAYSYQPFHPQLGTFIAELNNQEGGEQSDVEVEEFRMLSLQEPGPRSFGVAHEGNGFFRLLCFSPKTLPSKRWCLPVSKKIQIRQNF